MGINYSAKDTPNLPKILSGDSATSGGPELAKTISMQGSGSLL